MFELGALTAGEDLQAMEWVRFKVDTGAAQTAIPSDWADKVPVKEGTEAVVSQARWLRYTNPWSQPNA